MNKDPLARALADAWDDAPVEAFVDDPSASILAAIPPDTADAMRAGLLLAEVAGTASPVALGIAAGLSPVLSGRGPTLAAALADLLARLGDGR